MKEIIKNSLAIVGIVIGAGFATGQEILQFFTNYGLYSFLSIFIAALIMGYSFIRVMNTGLQLQAPNHNMVLTHYLGHFLGTIIDYILTLFLFLLAVVMSSGAASTFHQSFHQPYSIGLTLFLVILLLCLLLDFSKIIAIISGITPFMIIIIIIIMIYQLLQPWPDIHTVNRNIELNKTPSQNFLQDSILYASLQIAAAFSFLSVLGRSIKNKKILYGVL